MSTVISVENVSLGYKLYPRPSDVLREVFLGTAIHDTYWALKDVSFRVAQGERVGIVGPNGAGKSSLLKAICGNVTPSAGRIEVSGRISSLLSMVPAWNEDDSGVENIRFNLLMKGIPAARIPTLVEEIIEFTELGAFIYRPVKTYSTGMSARLSFAIATAIDPDILIIDEVLGTGDGYFAGKAMNRMKEFCARGNALLFVSHATTAILQMCDRAIWMQNGEVRMDDTAKLVVARYELDYRKSEDESIRTKQIAQSSIVGTSPLPEDITEGALRLRIVAATGYRFGITHYVRRIAYRVGAAPWTELPMEAPGLSPGKEGGIDSLGSEWGRVHERRGSHCRILQRVTGRNPGGHFLIPMEALQLNRDGDSEIEIQIEHSFDQISEAVVVEYLDIAAGRWQRFTSDQADALKGEWFRITARSRLPRTLASVDRAVVQKLLAKSQAAVEIQAVEFHVAGESQRVVREQEPFAIVVEVEFRERIPIADVGIKISRADGFYVFWQSSGMTGSNLVNAEGTRAVRFLFDSNPLGAGDYHVNAYVADGWSYPTNYPYAEVYHRVTNALQFKVQRELPDVDFGVLATRVRTEVA